jgi:hypothetical protein
MFFEIFKGGSLRHVIGEFVQVAKPEFAFLPVCEADGLHEATIPEWARGVNGVLAEQSEEQPTLLGARFGFPL